MKGVLPIALESRKRGKRAIVVPHENVREAAMVSGMESLEARTLLSAVAWTGAGWNDNETCLTITKPSERATPFMPMNR